MAQRSTRGRPGRPFLHRDCVACHTDEARLAFQVVCRTTGEGNGGRVGRTVKTSTTVLLLCEKCARTGAAFGALPKAAGESLERIDNARRARQSWRSVKAGR